MRVPSTSDLVHSHTNRAYDKMAVISENIDKLDLIYEFIFKYFEHLKGVLSLYVDKENNQDIEGYKNFLNGIQTKSIKFDDNNSEIEATIGLDATDVAEPYVYLSFTRTWENPLGESETTEVGRLKLGYSQELSKGYLEGPDTVGSISNSLVTVNYLKSVLEGNTEDLTNKLTAYLTEVLEGETKAVTSDGIYKFVKAFVDDLTTGHETNKDNIQANADEIANLKDLLNNALKTINDLKVTIDGITSGSYADGNYVYAYYSDTSNLTNPTSSIVVKEPVEGDIYTYDHLYSSYTVESHYGTNGELRITGVSLTEPLEEETGVTYKCVLARECSTSRTSVTYVSDSVNMNKSIFIKVKEVTE